MKKRTVAKITPKMSEFWLDFYTTISEEKKDFITNWLVKKEFYDISDTGKIRFFLKIDGNKYPDYKAFTWRVIIMIQLVVV